MPPFKEYIMSGKNRRVSTLLRSEQVTAVLGENFDFDALKPAMILSVPAVGGPAKTPLYDWLDVQLILDRRNSTNIG